MPRPQQNPSADGSIQTQRRNREAHLSSGSTTTRAHLFVEECGNNVPLLENLDEMRLERFQFAAPKLSEGKLDRLDRANTLAKAEWPDLLIAAGFEAADAHRSWLPEQTR